MKVHFWNNVKTNLHIDKTLILTLLNSYDAETIFFGKQKIILSIGAQIQSQVGAGALLRYFVHWFKWAVAYVK